MTSTSHWIEEYSCEVHRYWSFSATLFCAFGSALFGNVPGFLFALLASVVTGINAFGAEKKHSIKIQARIVVFGYFTAVMIILGTPWWYLL